MSLSIGLRGQVPWYDELFIPLINTVNTNNSLLTGALGAYQQSTLAGIFGLYPTTTQMQEYVHSVAFAGVTPSQLGSANQVLVLNSNASAIAGITDAQLFAKVKKTVKKYALIFGG